MTDLAQAEAKVNQAFQKWLRAEGQEAKAKARQAWQKAFREWQEIYKRLYLET